MADSEHAQHTEDGIMAESDQLSDRQTDTLPGSRVDDTASSADTPASTPAHSSKPKAGSTASRRQAASSSTTIASGQVRLFEDSLSGAVGRIYILDQSILQARKNNFFPMIVGLSDENDCDAEIRSAEMVGFMRCTASRVEETSSRSRDVSLVKTFSPDEQRRHANVDAASDGNALFENGIKYSVEAHFKGSRETKRIHLYMYVVDSNSGELVLYEGNDSNATLQKVLITHELSCGRCINGRPCGNKVETPMNPFVLVDNRSRNMLRIMIKVNQNCIKVAGNPRHPRMFRIVFSVSPLGPAGIRADTPESKAVFSASSPVFIHNNSKHRYRQPDPRESSCDPFCAVFSSSLRGRFASSPDQSSSQAFPLSLLENAGSLTVQSMADTSRTAPNSSAAPARPGRTRGTAGARKKKRPSKWRESDEDEDEESDDDDDDDDNEMDDNEEGDSADDSDAEYRAGRRRRESLQSSSDGKSRRAAPRHTPSSGPAPVNPTQLYPSPASTLSSATATRSAPTCKKVVPSIVSPESHTSVVLVGEGFTPRMTAILHISNFICPPRLNAKRFAPLVFLTSSVTGYDADALLPVETEFIDPSTLHFQVPPTEVAARSAELILCDGADVYQFNSSSADGEEQVFGLVFGFANEEESLGRYISKLRRMLYEINDNTDFLDQNQVLAETCLLLEKQLPPNSDYLRQKQHEPSELAGVASEVGHQAKKPRLQPSEETPRIPVVQQPSAVFLVNGGDEDGDSDSKPSSLAKRGRKKRQPEKPVAMLALPPAALSSSRPSPAQNRQPSARVVSELQPSKKSSASASPSTTQLSKPAGTAPQPSSSDAAPHFQYPMPGASAMPPHPMYMYPNGAYGMQPYGMSMPMMPMPHMSMPMGYQPYPPYIMFGGPMPRPPMMGSVPSAPPAQPLSSMPATKSASVSSMDESK